MFGMRSKKWYVVAHICGQTKVIPLEHCANEAQAKKKAWEKMCGAVFEVVASDKDRSMVERQYAGYYDRPNFEVTKDKPK